jgi:hypothetical protein
VPLWPLIRVPAALSASVVVFCLAFVAVSAEDAQGAHVQAAPGHSGDQTSGCWLAAAPALSTPLTDFDALRLEAVENCRIVHARLNAIRVNTGNTGGTDTGSINHRLAQLTGQMTPVGSAKSIADVHAKLVQLETLDSATNAKLDTLHADLTTDGGSEWLDELYVAVSDVEGAVYGGLRDDDTDVPYLLEVRRGLYDDNGTPADQSDDEPYLAQLVAAVEAQGPNSSIEPGTDAEPVAVELASSETQLEEAANAGTSALWFIAGLLALVAGAYALTRAVMPR